MKYVICLFVVTVLFVLGIASFSLAQDRDTDSLAKMLEIGGYGIFVVPQKGNFDSTGGGGGFIRCHILERLAVETAIEYAQWDFSTSVTGASSTLNGNLDVIPITGTLLYYFPSHFHFKSYIGGGITGMLIDGSATGTLTPGGASKIEFDNAIGWHICGGIDWVIANNVYFNLDSKYTSAVSKTSESTSEAGTSLSFDDMEMHNFSVRLGLSYKF